MPNYPNSPRRQTKGLFQKKLGNNKKRQKEVYTHAEFMTFLDSFTENLKEKHYELLSKEVVPKAFNFKKDVYARWMEQLKDRMFSSYIFKDDVDFYYNKENDNMPNTPLIPRKPIKTFPMISNLPEDNNVLESYRSSAFKGLYTGYKEQLTRNNMRRKVLLDAVKERVKFHAYFQAYDLICGELEDLQRRRTQLKKKTVDFEKETIREYLDRYYEFLEIFGSPDQFSDNQLIYPDVLVENVHPVELHPSSHYFCL